MLTTLLALSPWLFLVGFVLLRVRLPHPLPDPPTFEDTPPLVSIVVPARNERHNIEACVESLGRSTYPRFEMIVVDDNSDDGTGDAARGADPGRAERYRILDGKPLPPGWFGKPWACFQGASEAAGQLLLFTDADTTHGPTLLARAVSALRDDGAQALTLLGRQRMDTFWERVLQPQFFVLLLLRYPDLRTALPPRRWRSAIANGQYILMDRGVYDGLGGHRAVAAEVVEDQRLAQELVRAGKTLSVRGAEDEFSTRMYRSLSEIVEGWSKNLHTAALQSLPGAARLVVAPISLVVGALLWLAPPVILIGAAGMQLAPLDPSLSQATSWAPVQWILSPEVLRWSAWATGLSVLVWILACIRLGAPARYGVLYPLGAFVAGLIYVRSWTRGSHIRWKGRDYGPSATWSAL